MDEIETTRKESEDVIAKSEALIKEAEEQLARSGALFAELGIDPVKLTEYVGGLEGDRRDYYEREMQAFRDELERDVPAPSVPAASSSFRAARSMV